MKLYRCILTGLCMVLIAGCEGGNSSNDINSVGVPDEVGTDEPDWPELGALICGSASYVDGAYVWTDYVYDDRGANSDEAEGGDAEYPKGMLNTADIVQVQIGRGQQGISVRFILQTLVDENAPIVGIAFDTDNDSATGASSLPGGAFTAEGSLGVDLLMVLQRSGGMVLQYSDGSWEEASHVSANIDVDSNTITGVLPYSVVNPNRDIWRAFAVAGVNSSGVDSWPDGGTIYDVAFVTEDDGKLGRWQSIKQGEILSGLHSADDAAASIDFAKLSDGVTEQLPVPTGRLHIRLYHSAVKDEGVSFVQQDLTSGFEFLGPYQPYTVYVPDDVAEPLPVLISLSGNTGNHVGDQFGGGDDGPPSWGTNGNNPRWLSTFDLNEILVRPALTVMPLSRRIPIERADGAPGFGDIVERDLMDVLDDVKNHFITDPDRVVLSGVSSGGHGAFRIGSLYPDRFSALLPIVGSAVDSLDVLENLNNLPVRMVSAGVDPFVTFDSTLQGWQAFDELEYDYVAYHVETRIHGGMYPLTACLGEPGIIRNSNPARVNYTVIPSMFLSDPERNLELAYDKAYWASGIVVRPGSASGNVKVTNMSRSDRESIAESIPPTQYDNILSGRDLCGPNPEVQTNDIWTERGIQLVPGDPQPVFDGLDLQLTDIESVTVDLMTIGLSVDELRVDVIGNGFSGVRLKGNWPSIVKVFRDSSPFGEIASEAGIVEISDDMSSGHSYLIRR